jgi:hypothetical protein
MEKYKKYKEAFPNKTDAQCIESLCWEVSDKVETIHKLLKDMADKKYTEEDVIRLMFNATKWDTFKEGEVGYNMTLSEYIQHCLQILNKQDK